MLSLRKQSQDISEATCKWISLPPLDREWNDEQVYNYFKLSKQDIQLIKSTKISGYKDIQKKVYNSHIVWDDSEDEDDEKF